MRASFDDSGNLILSPETTLERMAAKAFVQSMRTRNKPEILIAGVDVPPGQNVRATGVSLIAQESEDVAGQQRLDEVARSVGGI